MRYPKMFNKHVCYHEPWCYCQFGIYWGNLRCDCWPDKEQAQQEERDRRVVAESLCFAIAVTWHRYYCEYRSPLSGLQCRLEREHRTTNHAGCFGNTWWQEQVVEGEPVDVGSGRN